MADLTPLLQEIRGIYTDRPRDRLPVGSVWEMVDWVPLTLQAGARMRGAWKSQLSAGIGTPVDGMLYAPFRAGDRLLAAAGTSLVAVDTTAVTTHGAVTSIAATKQNPVMHRDRVIVPAADGTTAARYVTFVGGVYAATNAPVTALTGKYATVWKDRLILGGSAANPSQVGFSKPGDPTAAWDSLSLVNTSYDLTGLAAIGNAILVMHNGSVERLRGTIPPDSTLSDPTGDMILDTLADRVGCYDARSIAYWNENVLFADSRGITLTDAATVRNVIVQAGAQQLWQDAWLRGGNTPLSVAAVVHRDYYIITLRHTALPPVTIVVDLPTRRIFEFANIDARAFAFAVGASEKLFGTDEYTAGMVTDLTPLFDPDPAVYQIDGDGATVLPTISTAFAQLTKEIGMKRVQDVHVTYEAHRDDALETVRMYYVNAPTGTDQIVGELPPSTKYVRRSMPLNRRLPGLGLTLTLIEGTKDARLYDISVRAFAEEQNRL